MVKIGSLLFFLLFCMETFAETKVSAVVKPNPIYEDERTILRVEVISDDAERFGKPTFNATDFEVIDSGTEITFVPELRNGRFISIRRSLSQFVLFPKKSGNLRIQNIKVQAGNTTRTSEDILIKVLPSNAPKNNPTLGTSKTNADDENPAKPQNFLTGGSTDQQSSLPARFNSDFTVYADIQKKAAFVGEPVVVEYWVYDSCALIQMDVQKWPTFNGFWKEDLEITTRHDMQPLYVGNKRMRKAFLARFALYPLKPGKIPLDKLVVVGKTLDRNCEDPNIMYSPFSLGLGAPRSESHASQDAYIEVQALPNAGRPQNFSGAVGSFTLNLSADKTTVQANSPLTLNLSIEGSGNFNTIEEFKLELPSDFEVYETKKDPKNSLPLGARKNLDSSKNFQYLILPRKEGSFTIPAAEWSFFNPKTQKYESVKTEAINIQVTPDPNAGNKDQNSYAAGNTPEINNTQNSTPAMPSVDWNAVKPLLKKALGILLALIGLALLFFFVKFVLSWLKKKKLEQPKAGPSLWKKELKFLEQKKSTKEFYNETERLVYSILDGTSGSSTRGLARIDLENLWKEKGLSPEMLRRSESILETCDKERFAPGDKNNSSRARILEDLRILVEKSKG